MSKIDIAHVFFPTYELKQNILSDGSRVEVISPEGFRTEIQNEYLNAAQHYEK